MGLFIFFFILLRGALPRTRYHRLMDLGWKVLIPVALVWTMVTAAFVLEWNFRYLWFTFTGDYPPYPSVEMDVTMALVFMLLVVGILLSVFEAVIT
jgi:hypothetical protein